MPGHGWTRAQRMVLAEWLAVATRSSPLACKEIVHEAFERSASYLPALSRRLATDPPPGQCCPACYVFEMPTAPLLCNADPRHGRWRTLLAKHLQQESAQS